MKKTKRVEITVEEFFCDFCHSRLEQEVVCDVCGSHVCPNCYYDWGACNSCPGEVKARADCLEKAYNKMVSIQTASNREFQERKGKLEAELDAIAESLKSKL